MHNLMQGAWSGVGVQHASNKRSSGNFWSTTRHTPKWRVVSRSSCITKKHTPHGNKTSSNNNGYLEEWCNVNEEGLDVSKVDKLQIKALKELSIKTNELEDKKADMIT